MSMCVVSLTKCQYKLRKFGVWLKYIHLNDDDIENGHFLSGYYGTMQQNDFLAI